VSIKYNFYNLFLGPARSGQFRLEGLDGIFVFDAHVLLDVPLKDDDGVGVLLRLAQGTLVGSFKPGDDALGMKHVFT
jgi:hypothetical protein